MRLIARLDIKGPNLVKGVQLEGLRVLGKPEQFARYYYDSGADELIYLDAVASLYGRNSLLDIVEKTSREIFIPLAVGGGLRNLDDIRAVLRSGADKVAINTAAIQRPELISEASRAFGSSTIIVSVEAIKKRSGEYEAYVDNGREATGVDAFDWAIRAAELGAGELLVTSIGREGTGTGFDLELTRRIAESVSIPVIASGGAGTVDHIHQVIEEGRADAASVASILHYNFVRTHQSEEADFSAEGNLDFLRGGGPAATFSRIEDVNIAQIKEHLASRGIDCRFPVTGTV